MIRFTITAELAQARDRGRRDAKKSRKVGVSPQQKRHSRASGIFDD